MREGWELTALFNGLVGVQGLRVEVALGLILVIVMRPWVVRLSTVLARPDMSRLQQRLLAVLVDKVKKRLQSPLALKPRQVPGGELILSDHVLWEVISSERNVLPLGDDLRLQLGLLSFLGLVVRGWLGELADVRSQIVH